jgi:hypothetical protein
MAGGGLFPVYNPADATPTRETALHDGKAKTVYQDGYGQFVYSGDGETGERLYGEESWGRWVPSGEVSNPAYDAVVDQFDPGMGDFDPSGGMRGFMEEFLRGLRDGNVSSLRFPDVPQQTAVKCLDNARQQISRMEIPGPDGKPSRGVKKALLDILHRQRELIMKKRPARPAR